MLIVAVILGAQALIGTPAYADFCNTDPPNPDRPGSGMVGAVDPTPLGNGTPNSIYDHYGYAGQTWYTYDLGCGGGAVNPNAAIDTWAGNQLLNIGKNLVGATNGLHYALLTDDLLKPLDDLIVTGTSALYNSIYAPWFGLVALLLGVVLFRSVFQGDLATIGRRGAWALAGMWLAAATYLTPLVYTHVLDELVITGTSQAQAGFLKEVGIDQRNALPTTLDDQVVVRNWERGEFGSPDNPQAKQYAADLIDAQAWSKTEVLAGADTGTAEPKKAKFRDVATKLKPTSVYGNFQGIDGSRIGAGFLAMVQGIAYSLFQLFAKAVILLAQILLRVLVLAGPIIGLIAMIFHEVLRSVGRALGSAMLNVVVISVLAGMHTLMLTWIFNPSRGFSLLTQMLLASLITLAFFLIGKPGRRMFQMVDLAVGAVSSAMPAAPPGLFARFGRRGQGAAPSPQDEFWEHVRASDPDAETGPARERRRIRPEATYTAAVVPQARSAPPALPIGGGGAVAGPARPAELPSGHTWQGTRISANSRPVTVEGRARGGSLPAGGASRTVDTSPVVDRSWDRQGPESVLVPSEINPGPMPIEPPRQPRRAEMEVVAGRPVWVVYRPSRGLEVRDSGNTMVN